MLTLQDCDENQKRCTISGTIPKASVIYARSQVWVGAPTELPPPQWDLNIIAVWNEEAKVRLLDNSTGTQD